jgi:hypothetical protein
MMADFVITQDQHDDYVQVVSDLNDQINGYQSGVDQSTMWLNRLTARRDGVQAMLDQATISG